MRMIDIMIRFLQLMINTPFFTAKAADKGSETKRLKGGTLIITLPMADKRGEKK